MFGQNALNQIFEDKYSFPTEKTVKEIFINAKKINIRAIEENLTPAL